MKARIHIMPKSGVLDPQGKAIQGALAGLGFEGILDARQGKVIELSLTQTDPARATAEIDAMCRKLLANPVMENFRIELLD
jgi:phosphoribosylformylglycinamidine synthase subunit PurS